MWPAIGYNFTWDQSIIIFIHMAPQIIFILFTPPRTAEPRPLPVSVAYKKPKLKQGNNTHTRTHAERQYMASTKMAVVAILAALLLMAAAEPALATAPSLVPARKLQMPRIMDVISAESKLACLPAGGFCMFRPMDCCGNCGCLYPVGVCYGSRCEE